MSIEMKNIHASLKILGKCRTVYLNNEMLSKMVHVGMTVSIGEKYITCICGYNNFFPFNYYYYWYYLEVWPQSVHAFPPCFRCSYKMIKYTRSYIIIRNLLSVLHDRLILTYINNIGPTYSMVRKCMQDCMHARAAGLPRQ